MKNLTKVILSIAIIPIALSCGGSKEPGNETNQPTDREDSGPKNLTVQEAADSLSASDESKGKEVTISAYNWEVSETTTGTVRLNLGDTKAEGMVTSTFYAEFPESKKEELSKIAKNAKVTVKGKLNSDAYSKFITECEIVGTE